MIKINGQEIMTPQELEAEDFFIEETARLASGKLVVEKIARKKRFNLVYPRTAGDELDKILNLAYSDTFVTFEYPDEKNEMQTVTVKAEDTPRSLVRSTANGHYYDSWELELVEQ